MNTIEINNVYKKYSKNASYAITDINMFTKEGEIVGLLGQNGAGKSTILKCITGTLSFDKGDILVCNNSIIHQSTMAKANFGMVTDNHAVFENMTGIEYLNFMANIYRVAIEERKQRVEELQQQLKLGDAINNQISSYSHGMKQKISIMGSLIHKPKIWIMDEPMVGLDPQSSRVVKDMMTSYKQQGNTVLFSSHNLDTVEKLCDRAYIISNGKLIKELDLSQHSQRSNDSLEDYFFELVNGKV